LVNSVGASLLEGVFPNFCALCGLRSHRWVPLCLECEQELPENHCACTRCAIPLPPRADSNTPQCCGHCLANPPPFDRVIAPWLYGEYFAHLLHRWKYQREVRMTPLLAALWKQRTAINTPIDLMVPVPLHWRRRWHRGFNQSELLAEQLLTTCPELKFCKLDHRRVKRQRSTPPQAGMTAAARTRNLRGAFTVSEPCDNLRIAIVDDVLTTGATASAMAGVLTKAGASYIEVWCLARTPAPGT
jgi:ComF family protein